MIKSSETRDDGSYEGKSLLGIVAMWEIPILALNIPI